MLESFQQLSQKLLRKVKLVKIIRLGTVFLIFNLDTYEVRFDDGYLKVLKAHRMSKATGKALQSSPLFDPVSGTKQERRDRKRKINVAALFGKRARANSQEDISNSRTTENSANLSEEIESWTPK